MKKILFATTAIVAAGLTTSANAAEWETGVNGYYFLGLAVSDSDNGQDGVGVLRDGEFHVNGRLTADNGLTFQARIEVEGFTSNDQIDENWGRVSGSFGALMIGSNDTVGYENSVGVIYAPGARIGYADAFCLTSVCAAAGFSPAPGIGADNIGIHYSSPDFMGFQVHGTYQPSTATDGLAFPGQTPADVSGDSNNPVFAGQNGGEDLWNIAAAYNGDFGDFSFGLSGQYTDIDNTPDENWGLAARVGFSGFTVAGFYEDNFGTDEFGIGAQYSTGPWTVAGGYSDSDGNGQFASGWVTYAVAPGVLVTGGLEYANADNDGQGGDLGGLGYLTLRF